MKLTFKDEHRPFVQTFEVISDGRVLASGVRPDRRPPMTDAFLASLHERIADLRIRQEGESE